MVLATILGLSISLVPCLMFGVIIMISFLLCNCEYIGETVAKHFCAWKNRRRERIKSHSIKPNNSVTGKRNLASKPLIRPPPFSSSAGDVIQRHTNMSLAVVNFENHIVEPASAPAFEGDLDKDDEPSTSGPPGLESDPPPSYDECIRSKTPEEN